MKLDNELDTLVDSVVADAEYSYDEGLAIASSTIRRGTRGAECGRDDEAAQGVSRKGVPDFEWDEGTGVNATVQLANASVADVLQIAGQQQKIPGDGNDCSEREGCRGRSAS